MFLNVFNQVAILLILIILGFILAKAKILSDESAKGITDMVLLLVTPCVIIKSFVREFNITVLKNLIISFLIAILVHIGFIVICHLALHSKDKLKERVLRFGAVFSNCGFMSIPLQQAILGDEGVFYGSSFVAIFNLFVWSYGIILMSGDKKYMSPKKLIINPGIIGLSIGLVIFFLSLPVPKIIFEPISYMASLNTPLPMIIIGYHLSKSNIFDGFKDFRCLFGIFLKIFVLPAISLIIMYLCGVRGVMLVSTIIACSAPCAAITTMFSAKFGCDTPLSVNMVSLSTILSLISMPILITVAQLIA